VRRVSSLLLMQSFPSAGLTREWSLRTLALTIFGYALINSGQSRSLLDPYSNLHPRGFAVPSTFHTTSTFRYHSIGMVWYRFCARARVLTRHPSQVFVYLDDGETFLRSKTRRSSFLSRIYHWVGDIYT